jgi:Mlc titration factor MtfA (ptsG expression regulator)
MIFHWFKQRQRQKILARPFPKTWEEILGQNIWQSACLSTSQMARLRRLVRVFMAEKNWEGCNGLTLTEEMQVTIAGMIAVQVAGLPEEEYFDHVLSILVYPEGYVAKETQVIGTGLVIEGESDRIGEAWYRGPVILSWSDVIAAAEGRTWGRNVVFHEMAHQLDMINGRSVDGCPVLKSTASYDRWTAVMDREYQQLVENCRHRRRSVIDCYGATNPGEFFAVISEVFFEAGIALREYHPDLYAILMDFYGLDTALWEPGE